MIFNVRKEDKKRSSILDMEGWFLQMAMVPKYLKDDLKCVQASLD